MIPNFLLNPVIGLALVPLAAGQGQPPTGTHSPHGNLPTPCQNCHTFTGWKPIRGIPEFDHDKTSYPLRGMHAGVQCTQCHVKPVFSNVSTKCAACHADIHKRQFGATCEQCHSVKGWNIWLQQIKEHQNRFPLIGAHAALDCDSCHTGAATGQFRGLSTQCYSCHAKDYQQATGPNHVTAAFPTSCEQCHSMDTWFSAKFDHLKFTGFALTGMHGTLECTACHVGGRFKGTPANCVGCHLPDFQKTTNPNHVALGIPQSCGTCHTTAAWQPATFDHSLVGFPLNGAHAALTCAQCHVNGNYNLTSGACATCHIKDYQGTTNPNHVQAAFPTDCTVCHNTTSWANAKFNHTTTGFPLTGFHTALQCSQCHMNNNYKLNNSACVTCHLKDFQGTTNPNHVQGGFPQQCNVCHNTSAWIPASFNHNNTAFPLTGAHTTVPCANCHVNQNYTTLPTNCYGCHQSDYQSTTNPNHLAAQFPTTCQTCHSTTSWLGAAFSHIWFPIYSGPHVPGVWNTCGDCHRNPSNFLAFSCINCHTHNKTTTDQQHQGVGGYVYNSPNCYQCHPTGQGGG